LKYIYANFLRYTFTGNDELLADLNKVLSEHGLLIRGGFNLDENELNDYPEINTDLRSLVMVGVAGSSFWPEFQSSSEYRSYLQGKVDPLDRWSKRIGDLSAKTCLGQAVYPFEGPPYYPFIQWAQRCETLHSSKMGFSIHPEYGLWHAFRFALLLPDSYEELDVKNQNDNKNPCITCADSPCLNSCPVSAYTEAGFDPDVCFTYLQHNENGKCRTKGCIARRSCPEGANFRYEPKHAEFHMTAFYQSQKERTKSKGSSHESGV